MVILCSVTVLPDTIMFEKLCSKTYLTILIDSSLRVLAASACALRC
jgi:hypothetical protein